MYAVLMHMRVWTENDEYFYILASGYDSELYLPASQPSTHSRQHYTKLVSQLL